jgi:hypothetical protein
MGKHKESLEILIHQLGDFVGAETYCVTNGQSTGVVPAEINDDRSHQTTPARSSSLAVTKPLPSVLKELPDEDELSLDDLLERRTLFSMLFKTYIGIKEPDLMMARTMHLLNTQGFYLDTVEVKDKI